LPLLGPRGFDALELPRRRQNPRCIKSCPTSIRSIRTRTTKSRRSRSGAGLPLLGPRGFDALEAGGRACCAVAPPPARLILQQVDWRFVGAEQVGWRFFGAQQVDGRDGHDWPQLAPARELAVAARLRRAAVRGCRCSVRGALMHSRRTTKSRRSRSRRRCPGGPSLRTWFARCSGSRRSTLLIHLGFWRRRGSSLLLLDCDARRCGVAAARSEGLALSKSTGATAMIGHSFMSSKINLAGGGATAQQARPTC
jgi:hypothetical protein